MGLAKIKHNEAPICSLDTGALSGLRHRTVLDHRNGSAGLAIWQEEHLPGFATPLHRHDCEETITVLEGAIEAFGENESFQIGPLETFLIPEWTAHGFKVVGERPVLLLAVFNNSDPGVFRMDGSRSNPPWEGGHSDHLS